MGRFERIHPHASQHVFDKTDQLPPATGILRLYVDGTAGNDAGAGTSWATAWKTLLRGEIAIAEILLPNPTAVVVEVFFRGAFATETLRVSASLQGLTRVHLIHHVDDMTTVKSGTVNTKAVATLKHGLPSITFNGFVPAAGDEGSYLVLEAGGNRLTTTILRVNGLNVETSTMSWPAWVVNGITATIRVPSVSGIDRIVWKVGVADDEHSATYELHCNVVFGLSVRQFQVESSNCVAYSVTATDGTYPFQVNNCDYAIGAVQRLAGFPGWPFDEAVGLDTGAYSGVGGQCDCGLTSTNAAGTVFARGSTSRCILTGRLNKVLSYYGGLVIAQALMTNFDTTDTCFSTSNLISRGRVRLYYTTDGVVNKCSFLELPAAGIVSGLIHSRFGSTATIQDCDGTNTGAGADLRVLYMDEGGTARVMTGADGLKGKHGFVAAYDSNLVTYNSTWTENPGSGPDVLLNGATWSIRGNFVKSAVNTIASAILQAERGSRVVQGTGKNFTLPAGSGNNVTDYGADGPIVAKDGLADIRLGNLTGGTGATTGPGATLRNGSRLVHAGVGPSGVAPLVLGGLPASPWPAAALTDAGAVVPEGCLCVPGVT